MTGDDGAATVEFTLLSVVLLVPLVYLVLAIGQVQAAAFAASTAAREAGRAYTTATTDESGRTRAWTAVKLAAEDQGLKTPPTSALRLRCSDGPCLSPGSSVVVTVRFSVRLPGLPALGEDRAVIPVTATYRAPVDQYRNTP